MELRSTAYMWRVIENCLPAKIKTEVKGMTMFEDRYVSITMSCQRTGLKTHAKALMTFMSNAAKSVLH